VRVLIAGSGDLGGRIAFGLRDAGAEVVRIARRPRPDEPEVHALDLTQPLGAPIDGEFDVLVHCLSPASRDEASYRAVYVDALRHLRAGLPAVSRVVFVSSTAVYGDHGGAWIDETADCLPSAFNGRVICDAEQVALAGRREALVLRLGGLYGPGREMLLRRVRSGEPLPVSDPPLYTNRIHVDDAAAAAVHLIRQGAAGIFNLVDDAPAAQPEVLDWLADRMGLPRLVRTAAGAAPENKRVANAKLRNTGFVFRHADFRTGYDALLR
jgi:nucleoside-diphosphate-sugar epimerase